jgi:hypothetical protein
LHAIASDAGIKTLGTPGQATFVGNGVAVVHRITDGPTTVQFGESVNLIDLDGNTVIAEDVTQWEPDIAVKRTAVVFYEPVNPITSIPEPSVDEAEQIRVLQKDDLISIRGSYKESMTVSIINTLGKSVYSRRYRSMEHPDISTCKYAPGIYILQLQNDGLNKKMSILIPP